MVKDEDAWFAPKRVGYGAGLPIAWQGWALLAAYIAFVVGAARWLLPQHQQIVFGAVAFAATAAMMLVTARHTRGGWKWRSGGEG